jgi:glycerophosphoryl diester phosphodiesterase
VIPLLLGHRGARKHAPENTYKAFDLALKHGCDGFEFDVRRTCDCRAVICHDPKLHHHAVAESTYPDLQAAMSTVACLEEVIGRYAGKAFLDIELKVPQLEDAVLTALHEGQPCDYVISSFLSDVLDGLHARDPMAILGFIFDTGEGLMRWSSLNVQYVVAQHGLVSRELVEDVHAAGREIFVWTVNHEREMVRFAEWGVDGIISDDTKLLGETFRGRR